MKESYAVQAAKVAQTQREAGWSERSIELYAREQKILCCDENGELCKGILFIGAGLAQDNSRFGVPLTHKGEVK